MTEEKKVAIELEPKASTSKDPGVPKPKPESQNLEQNISASSVTIESNTKAVILRDVKVQYGTNIPILRNFKKTNVVLENCSLTVTKKNLIALLGASSSGKTTLLNTIVGLKKVSKGEVWVLGGHPGSHSNMTAGPKIGYMPQDLALMGELTIMETMGFFGMIYKIHEKVFPSRIQKYVETLKLPNLERPVRYLSGGQRRRLSFVLAILHSPKVVILDEPCVGVDPLVRKKMWDILREYVDSSHGRTVITTTQYVEEAKNATEVAFLYKGRIIAQGSPANFKEKFGIDNLNDVFYKLTQDIDTGNTTHPDQTVSHSKEDNEKLVYKKTKWSLGCAPNRLRAMIFKNRIRYVRNWTLMLFLLLLPIFQVSIFNATIDSELPELWGTTLGCVNHELKSGTQRNLEPSTSKCPVDPACIVLNKSGKKACTFMRILGSRVTFVTPVEYFSNEADAQNALEKGETRGTLKFGESFTSSLIALSMQTAKEEDFNQSHLYVHLENMNEDETYTVKYLILGTYQSFREQLAEECKTNKDTVGLPIVLIDPIFGNSESGIREFVSPGALCVIVFFLPVSITALTLLTDKNEGLLQRSYVAGVYFSEMLFAHTVIQFFIVCLQALLVTIVHFAIFSNKCKGLYAELVLLLILQGMVGATLGFFISAICSKEEAAIELSIGLLFPIILLSGMFWSLEGMKMIPREIAKLLPMSYAIIAGRNIITRGWDMVDWGVFKGLLSSFIWILVFWNLALWATKLNFK